MTIDEFVDDVQANTGRGRTGNGSGWGCGACKGTSSGFGKGAGWGWHDCSGTGSGSDSSTYWGGGRGSDDVSFDLVTAIHASIGKFTTKRF